MKEVMSASVEVDVIKKGKEVAREMRVSFSSFVEGAIRASVGNFEPKTIKAKKVRGSVRRDEEVVGDVRLKLEGLRREVVFRPQPKGGKK